MAFLILRDFRDICFQLQSGLQIQLTQEKKEDLGRREASSSKEPQKDPTTLSHKKYSAPGTS